MIAYIGIALILLGVVLIMFMPMGKPRSPETGESASAQSTAASTEQTEEEKKAAEEQASADRAATLQNLEVPGNLPPIRVYFGSQTGTAEKLAGVLDEEAQMMGIEDIQVIDFNNYKEDEFPKGAITLVCVATHYEGDPCDNTRNFFKWLKKLQKDKTAKPFSGMNFSIFGLGDTSYEQFNEMGKVFDESFEKLGGKRIHEMGVGNAETFSTEDDFNKWKENLWQKVFALYEGQQTEADKKKALVRRQSSLLRSKTVDPNALPWIVDVNPEDLLVDEAAAPEYDMNMRNYLSSKPLSVKSIRQLRQKCVDGGSTIEVTFDLRGTGLTYTTAANSAIYATNRQADVEKFAQMFELDLDTRFKFTKNPRFTGRMTKTPFPTPEQEGMTFREALTKHIDLIGPISKKLLTAMIPLCEAQEDRTK